MSQKLHITLDENATARYLEWMSKKTKAEVDEDCEPSGVTISINIGPAHYGSDAYTYVSEELIDFGDATVDLIEG